MKLSKIFLCLVLVAFSFCPVSAKKNESQQQLEKFKENMVYLSYIPSDVEEFESAQDDEILTIVNGFAIRKYMLDQNYVLDLSRITEEDYVGENTIEPRAMVDAGLGYGSNATYYTLPSNHDCAHVVTAEFYNYSNDKNPIMGRHDLYLSKNAGWEFLALYAENDFDLAGDFMESVVENLIGIVPYVGAVYSIFDSVNELMISVSDNQMYTAATKILKSSNSAKIHLVIDGIGSEYEGELTYVEKWSGLSYATYSNSGDSTYVKSISSTFLYE